MRLRGKTVIVTGASSGIGRETAREFAAAGSNVVLIARNETALRELAARLSSGGARVLPAPADVRDEQAVNEAVERAAGEFGTVDVLVNNAGLGLAATISEGSLSNMRYLLDVNLFGPVYGVRAVVPHMRRQGAGAIVNVSSVASRIVSPYNGFYSATKAAMNAITDALRLELEADGIAVTAVYPGFTVTRFHENVIREVQMPSRSRLLRGVPARAAARAIVRAVRLRSRESYVTFGDAAAVAIRSVAPSLVDWGIRRFWLGSRSHRPQAEAENDPEWEQKC